MNVLRTATLLTLIVGIAGWNSKAAYAGDLDPSGPPAPTFKTLDEVRPGIPIAQDDIPFAIPTNGVYYLTEEIIAPPGTGNIIIVTNRVDHVTIDLGGFSISADPGDTDPGVAIFADAPATPGNLAVRNGTIRGINGPAIDAEDWSATIENLVIRDVEGFGIRANDDSTVRNCSITNVSSNAAMPNAVAIRLGENSTVRSSSITTVVSSSNSGEARGIQLGQGGLVEDNILRDVRGGNGADEVVAIGIDAFLHSRIANNTLIRLGTAEDGGVPTTAAIAAGINASASTIVGNTIEEIMSDGEIYGIVGAASNIRENHIRVLHRFGSGDVGFGIYALGESKILNNTLANIRALPAGDQRFAGIFMTSRAIAKNNHVEGDFRDPGNNQEIAGIMITGLNNFVRRNTVLTGATGSPGQLGIAIQLKGTAQGNLVLGNLYRGDLIDMSGNNLTDEPQEPNLTF